MACPHRSLVGVTNQNCRLPLPSLPHCWHCALSILVTIRACDDTRYKYYFWRPLIGAAAGAGGTMAAAGLVLPAIGFGAEGVVLGTPAAAIQASIGNVAAGSLFAIATSVGMAGPDVKTIIKAGVVGALVGCAVVAAQYYTS
ncbi:hypothetical protein BC940DRAFT_311881 [Gongronella butleri]|nr:hypothetical protein BC940DRAFT_311881 [Gongronella butleri]